MDKYIKQLLEEFSKIILPGFGAIVLEDEETGELMFNEYLTYNDGKLDAKIAEESNLDPKEVKNTIARYVRDIQTQIDKGETYDIFGLGFFTKNKDGEVEFNGNLKTGSSKNTAFGGSSPNPSNKNPLISSNKSNQNIENEKSNDSAITIEPKVSSEQQEIRQEIKAGSKTKDENQNKTIVSKTKSDTIKKKHKKDTKPPSIKPKKENKKRNFSPLLWIIIVLLIISIGGVSFIAINYDKVRTYMGWDLFDERLESPSFIQTFFADSLNENMIDTNFIANDSKRDTLNAGSKNLITETEYKNQPQVVEEIKEVHPKIEETTYEGASGENQTKNTESKTGSYHLIAGSFSVYENAEQLVTELKEKGLDAKIIGKIGALHFVSAQSYDSLEQAQKDLSNVRSKAPGAWVYKY